MARILIVDDESAIRMLLSMAFINAGYEVSTAQDGPEAIQLFANECFDVVLTDVMMPKMNGHELVQWIVERHPATRTVLMSGFDLGCQNCARANHCIMLQKPFRPNDALAAVASVLDQERRCA